MSISVSETIKSAQRCGEVGLPGLFPDLLRLVKILFYSKLGWVDQRSTV